MNRRHLLAAVTLAGLFVAAGSIEFAGIASATNANVAYAQTCDTATVTVTSQWDGGVIHVVITGPSPAIGFDVAPLESAGATFRIIPNPLTVTLSSSNGHLLGDLTHTFTADGCGQPTTTTSSTLPGIVPGAPTTIAQLTQATVVPPPQSTEPLPSTPAATAPASSDTTVVPRAPSTTHPIALPATGAGDIVMLLIVVGGFLTIGFLLVRTAKRDKKIRDGQ